ncbi:MAG: 4'-phosphopantetheinyl transferase superfamily protein [Eubacterium sp.]
MKLYTMYTPALQSAAVFNGRLTEVPVSRQQKAKSYRFARDRALSLGAGLLLNQALEEAGIDPRDVAFQASDGQKPVLKGHPDFHFNLSHSGDYAILGVADTPIGVDIEKMTDIPRALARHYFHKGEIAFLNGLSEEAFIPNFYRLWTLKESFMKATGLGFSLALDAFEIQMGSAIGVHQRVNEKSYGFTEVDDLGGYAISICVEGGEIGKVPLQEEEQE